MDKYIHYKVRLNQSSIPKHQSYNHGRLGMDKQFHSTSYWACDYLSMLGLKLTHLSKRGPLNISYKNTSFYISSLSFIHWLVFPSSSIFSLAKNRRPHLIRFAPDEKNRNTVCSYQETCRRKYHNWKFYCKIRIRKMSQKGTVCCIKLLSEN